MKFRAVYLTIATGSSYSEDEDRSEVTDLNQARDWAERAIKDFNAVVLPHERQGVVRVELLPDASDTHDWVKTSLETRSTGIVTYDTFKCNKCGITGTKYGSAPIGVDEEYKGIDWSFCSRVPQLLKDLEKRQKKRERRKNRVRMR